MFAAAAAASRCILQSQREEVVYDGTIVHVTAGLRCCWWYPQAAVTVATKIESARSPNRIVFVASAHAPVSRVSSHVTHSLSLSVVSFASLTRSTCTR